MVEWRGKWLALAGWQSGASVIGTAGSAGNPTCSTASASDREQYTVRDPRLQGRLPGSWLLGTGPDAAASRRRLAGALWTSGADRRELRRPLPTAPSIALGTVSATPGGLRVTTVAIRILTASRSSCTCTPCGGTLAVGCAIPGHCPRSGSPRVLPRSRPVNCARWFRSWRRSRIFGAPRGASIPWPRCSPSTFSPGWRTCAVRSRPPSMRRSSRSRNWRRSAPGRTPRPAATSRSPSPPCTG